MIIIRHHETCGGRPSLDGKLRGKCDCKVAPMDAAAREKIELLVASLEGDSLAASEEPEYFALRLDMLAEKLERTAHTVRMHVARNASKKSRDARKKVKS